MILRQIYQRFCNHQRTKEELLKTWIVKEESHSSQRFPQPFPETNSMTYITPSILAGKALAIPKDLENPPRSLNIEYSTSWKFVTIYTCSINVFNPWYYLKLTFNYNYNPNQNKIVELQY